ncbi:uncharacterized protein LOC118761216 [Octopus sinensis]|uniref:Uncharacterized protein LOC118761216 n=1 Tax=Octopus sinensis TaxID=2607531 RepID=A0A7E6EHU7_9MOLL|nr:uncharacterized protein LOC118761216 [Octopus sinensis]
MADSINIVSEALTQLGGKLIPLDALVNTGKTYWSSVHTVTRQIEEKSSLTKNEHPKPSEQPAGFQSMSGTADKEDTPKINDIPHSPDSIGNICYNQPSRCILPVTCLLDYFISKPNNSSVTPVNINLSQRMSLDCKSITSICNSEGKSPITELNGFSKILSFEEHASRSEKRSSNCCFKAKMTS